MSENTNNSNFSSSVSRKTGVGLTRKSFSQGICDVRNAPLLTPNRIIISASSLGTSRPSSDRYVSGYKRLGGLKNASESNVSKTPHLQSEVVTHKKDTDFNHNSDLPQRKSFSATNSSLLLKNENVSGVNVQRSQSVNRGQDYTTKALDERRGAGPATGNRTFKRWNDNCQKSVSSPEKGYPNSHFECTIVENYDLDLEQDEEDAVKDAEDGPKTANIGIISPTSPSKDSGYHSPRIETNEDCLSITVVGSVSQETSELFMNRLVPNRGNLMVVPERPTRSKHSAKKQSFDHSKQLSQPTCQQEARPSHPDLTVASTKELGQEIENDVKSDVLRCCKKELNQNEANKQVTRSLSAGDSEVIPVAKPRIHRRLTSRSIHFKCLEEDEYIGFASLPEQVHRKAVRRGFEFTLMVVGETGLGKSTLINSLFLMDLYRDRKVGNIEGLRGKQDSNASSDVERMMKKKKRTTHTERIQKTVELEKKELEIEERGVKLKLTIVDTPGFNDAVNAEESWKPIVNYVDKQFDGYFKAESGLNRKNIQDTRVHCCLYFISPYGHGLRPVDVMVMKKLHHKVNIIPLIAKADMLTKLEVKRLKEKVLHEIQKHNIHIYQYPDCDSDEDEEFKLQDKELKKSIPFAVVGSNTVVEAGGKKIRGRMYPWGIVEVENPLHSDFIKLRQMLISTHMQDLKDVTCDVHYENFRAEHISEQMTTTQRERGKLKRDSAANLDSALVTEKLLQEKDAEIKRMQEVLAQMQAQLQSNSPKPNGRIGQV